MREHPWRAAVAAVVMGGLLGCGGGPPATRAPIGPPGEYVGTRTLEPGATEDNRFYDGDLRAVVSVADAVVLVEVLDQEQRTTRQTDEDGGDLTSWVTRLRVREVVWSRPGAPEPPRTLVGADPFARPLSGHLLVPLVRERSWFPMSSSSYVTVTDTRGEPGPGLDPGWAGEVTGTRVDELGGRLRRTPTWPGATPGASLDERSDAVKAGLFPGE